MPDFIPKQYTKEPITIRIAPDKLAQIDASAAKFNMSRSEFINQCIENTTVSAVVFSSRVAPQQGGERSAAFLPG